MNTPQTETEAAIVERVSAQYLARGYQVERDVPLEGLPHRADLLARRGDETVLVEVRHPATASRAPALNHYARYAEARGWRFTVVLSGGNTPGEVEVPSREQVLQRIEDARKVAPAWIASLAATTAFEAAARYVLARTPRHILPNATPSAYLQALASRGLVTPEEEQILQRLVVLRNRAASGGPSAPEEDILRRALEITEALVLADPDAEA